MNRSRIDWPFQPLYTMNLAIGCFRNCFDGKCWARQMNNRFKWVEDFGKINFVGDFPDHIPGKGKYIFIGSMSDICFWKGWYLKCVLERCQNFPQHKFVFLTKDSAVYQKHEFTKNCWLGLTVTGTDTNKELMAKYERMVYAGSNNCFLSIEPLLGKINYIPMFFDKVICGAMADGSIKPKKEWIQSIKDTVDDDKLYWKKNIRKYL